MPTKASIGVTRPQTEQQQGSEAKGQSRQGQGRTLSLTVFRESAAPRLLTSGLQNRETNVCCFKPPVCGSLLY